MKTAKGTRILSLLLALLLLLAMTACSSKPANTPDDSSNPAAADDSSTPADSQDPEADDTAASTDTTEPVADSDDSTVGSFQLPIVTEPVTVKFWWPSCEEMLGDEGYDKADGYLYFREMEQRTGVRVEVDIPSNEAASAQFGLIMASDEIPDFMENFSTYYTAGLDHAVDEELVVPLNDLTEQMPNFYAYINADEEIRKQCTTDAGNIAGVPFIKISSDGQAEKNWCGMVVRGEWLDELGMDVPTTYSELDTLLGAMQDKYGDTAPHPLCLLSLFGNFVNSFGNAFHGGYNFTTDWMQIDGVVTHSVLTDGYRDFHKLIKSWIDKQYIDPDFASQARLWAEVQETVDDEFGVFSIQYTNTLSYLTGNAGRDFTMVALPVLKVDEDTPVHVGYTLDKASNISCIMATSDYVDVIARWWDYFFTEEGILLANYGVEGETFRYNENGDPEWIPEAFTSDDPRWNNSHFQCSLLLFNTPGVVHFDRELSLQDPMAIEIHDVWVNSYDTAYNYPGSAAMTMDEQETYSDIMADLNTYISEQTIKFVTGALDFDTDWDAFIEQVHAMDIDKAIELKQAAYDRYASR